ncbi:MAG: hypothetical protein GQ570_01010 [Helicobacteraceae bacterium]|nr:hypothetical protein [Helicobacteraceae bacterium]
MKGKILDYSIQNSSGVISAEDGKRYKFVATEWKSEKAPSVNQEVDFDITEDSAISIYLLNGNSSEDSKTIFGLVAIALTFFLGFIGTFISRVVVGKESVGAATMPTLIHFILTILLVIPVVGAIAYLIGTVYYMISNYKLVVNNN